MDIPTDVQTHDMPTSTIWIRDGIVYSTPKIGTTQEVNGAQMKQDMKKFRAIVGHEKVCMVVEINPKSKPARKEERDAVAVEMANIIKAMAIITTSPVTKMLANLFFGFKPPPYPAKMFLNEKDASSWIKQYV
jgi:hypothetical protein